MISGLVQGVCFRSYAQDKAESLGLKGWVMNKRDGKVETVFEGEKTNVEDMVSWCRKGPSGARVEKIEVKYETYVGDFDSFCVEYPR